MKAFRLHKIGLPAVLVLGLLACEDSRTTTAPGALATVMFNAPDSVRSGQSFLIDVSALNIGVNGIHNGHIDVTLPAPLIVISADASPGTTATFSNGSGASVGWNLGTLDSNSQSRLHINTVGTLPAGSAAQTLTVDAMMIADGIRPGDAVAHATIQLMP
jgi:hypothetical protein